MIALERVNARRSSLTLVDVSAAWGPGMHTIVGRPEDGGALLLSVIGGVAKTRGGSVRVLEGSPRSAAVRAQLARVPLQPTLPDALRVDEVLAVAARLRGDPRTPAEPRLAILGIEALARRAVRSLGREEARAVALAESLTSAAVRVLLIEEPLALIDGRAARRVGEALRAKAHAGCTVLATTASLRDAAELGGDCAWLRAGKLLGPPGRSASAYDSTLETAKLVIVAPDARDARALTAVLARSEEVDAVEHEASVVRVRGRGALALARAAGRASIEAGVAVVELRIVPPSLERARSTLERRPQRPGDAIGALPSTRAGFADESGPETLGKASAS